LGVLRSKIEDQNLLCHDGAKVAKKSPVSERPDCSFY
jgi:hypothetical protein